MLLLRWIRVGIRRQNSCHHGVRLVSSSLVIGPGAERRIWLVGAGLTIGSHQAREIHIAPTGVVAGRATMGRRGEAGDGEEESMLGQEENEPARDGKARTGKPNAHRRYKRKQGRMQVLHRRGIGRRRKGDATICAWVSNSGGWITNIKARDPQARQTRIWQRGR